MGQVENDTAPLQDFQGLRCQLFQSADTGADNPEIGSLTQCAAPNSGSKS